MNSHHFNPAGRLFEFMTVTWHSQNTQSIGATWAGYLEVDLNDRSKLYAALSQVLLLPDKARSDIEALANPILPKSQLLRPFDQVDLALEYVGSLTTQTASVKEKFHQGTLSDLETASAFLNGRALSSDRLEDPEQIDDTLQTIRRLANEIMEDASTAGLAPDVARLLVEYAAAIVRAVDFYRIAGPEGIAAEFERMLGGVLWRPSAYVEVREKSPSTLSKIAEVSKNVIALGALATFPADLLLKGADVISAIEQFFPPGP